MDCAAGKYVIATEKPHLRWPASQKDFKTAAWLRPNQHGGGGEARTNHHEEPISKSEARNSRQTEAKPNSRTVGAHRLDGESRSQSDFPSSAKRVSRDTT